MAPKINIDTLMGALPYQRKRGKWKSLKLDWNKEWERFDAKKLFEFDLAAINEEKLSHFRKRKEAILDSNHAALSILTRLVDGLCGYPITPSTPIAEDFANASAQGQKNLFGTELMYFQPSDELSAIAAVEAMACQGGRYVDNTSSQGLVLKTKNLFSVAGKRLPVIMTVMAREVNKGSLSIHCGHNDFYGVRNTGWAQLVAKDNQEFHDLMPIAFKTAELRQVMLPFMVIGDGFIKSHALENIELLSDEFLKYYVGPPNRLYQPDFEQRYLTGTFTDTDLTMEGQIAQDFAYRFVKRGIIASMDVMNQILNTNHQVVECYRTEDAEMVVVILGSAAGVIKDVVDYYRDVEGLKVGVVRPVLFNPPCYEEIAFGVRNAKVITVLERTGMAHNQLLLADLQAALQLSQRAYHEGRDEHQIYGRDYMPTLLHGVYGLGSKDFNKYDAAAVIENMQACLEKKRDNFIRDFFSGVEGPYTLKPAQLPNYKDRELGLTFIGIGAEGVKTALETAAVIYAEDGCNGRRYIQSGARYGAARKGAPVFMNLRISSVPIRNSSELTEHDVLAFFNEKFLSGEILREYVGRMNQNGLLVVNSPRTKDEILASFPTEMRQRIADKNIKVISVDATQAALKHLQRNLPGAMMLGLINNETGIFTPDAFEARFKSILEEKLGAKKGFEIVDSNIALLKEGFQKASTDPIEGICDFAEVSESQIPSAAIEPENFGQEYRASGLPVKMTEKDELGTIKPVNLMDNFQETFYQEMVEPIMEGKKVAWDHFIPVVPSGTSQYKDVSFMGAQLPIWDAAKCIACGMCAVSCPDSAIHATITDKTVPKNAAAYFKVFKKPPKGIPWKRFAMNINAVVDRCKGCGICAQVCPVDAFKMVDKARLNPEDLLPEKYHDLDNTYDAAQYVDRMPLNYQVLFVYSKMYPGKHTLCPGCGEGTINLLTFYALESLRNSPKGIETFYQGLKVLSDKNRRAIEHMIDRGFTIYNINATGCNQVSELVNPFNTRIYQSGHYGFGTASAAALGAKFALDQSYANGFNDVLTKIIVFAGDGAIYDIGNGPFNYALGENFDITWVIYNNEGYMNTGAQKSGATRFGCDRSTSPIGEKFAGKRTLHRRIVAQATAISHVYSAKLTTDNPFYAIKILKEAIAYCGPSVVEFFSYCSQGQQSHDWAGPLVSRMMNEARNWQIQVRRPFQKLDISANPEPEKIFPSKGKSFKKGVKREPATFHDVVGMLGQYRRHILSQEEDVIPELIEVNETVSLFRWLRNQCLAGYIDTMPTEEEVERIITERYK
jgi:pyruvate-ferredoxin/flavodoxin oxidoreductase